MAKGKKNSEPIEGKDDKGRFQLKNLFYLLADTTGRKPKFATPETLATKALEYFEWSTEKEKGKFTMAGLRVYCGMTRSTYHDYKNKPDFTDVIDHIEQILEAYFEQKLQWAGSTQGAIFWLKNKAGWKDEVESKVNQVVTNVTPQIISNTPPLADD